MNYIYTAYFYTTTIFEYSRDIYDNLRSATVLYYNASRDVLSCFPISRNPFGVIPVTCLNCEERCAGELYPSLYAISLVES